MWIWRYGVRSCDRARSWVFFCFIFPTLFLFVRFCIKVRESVCASLFCLITHRLHSCDGCMLSLPYVNHFPPSQKPGLISAAFMTRLYLNATDFSIPVLSPNTHWQSKNSQCFARQKQDIQIHIVHEKHEQAVLFQIYM